MVENSTDYHIIWNVDHWICSSSLPYYVESPGATIDLKELITVNDKEDKGSGSFSHLCWYQASYRFLSFKS